MRTHNKIITTLAIAAAVVAAPVSALGSPLLSGYGGPGAGEQQIVGGGLVGGGSGGGGSSSSGQTGSEAGRPQGASPAGRRGGSSPGAAGRGASHRAGADQGRTSSSSPSSTGGSPAGGSGAARSAAVASTTLGLSDGQLAMVAVIGVALLLAAVLTRWLAGLQRDGADADRRPMNLGGGT